MREYFTAWFTNVTGCALVISDISWCVTVAAESEAEALEAGLKDARELEREFGMPPHGIRFSEEELRNMAYVERMRLLKAFVTTCHPSSARVHQLRVRLGSQEPLRLE